MNDDQTRRKVLILVSLFDLVISGIVLLIYFGLLPIDITAWSIPPWVVGLVGGVWFLSALAILTYQLTKPNFIE